MVLEHDSYRSYLKAILAEKCRKNPGFSLRALAKHLGCASSTLSEVLNGKFNFSLEMLHKIAGRLALTTAETEYLCLLAQLESHRESPALRQSVLDRLSALNPERKHLHDLSLDEFKQIAEWHHSAILEMLSLDDFPFEAEAIAQRLGITKLQAEAAVERLLRLELLKRAPDGTYSRTAEEIRTESYSRNEALQSFYRQMLQKIAESLESQDPDERLSGFETVAFSREDLPEIRNACSAFMSEIARISDRSKKKRKDIYNLTLHFFNLTPKKGK